MANPSQRLINAGTVAALEFIVAKCKERRRDLDKYDHQERDEVVVRAEGFLGALAWVEGVCCEEINQIRARGVVL